MTAALHSVAGRSPRKALALGLGLVVFIMLIGLGTWQVERLAWKEGLIETIDRRMNANPVTLAEVEKQYAASGDVDYVAVTLNGTFLHAGERHFFTTWDGQTGFSVYTPLRLADGRFVFVNRGFVPYEMKDPAKRAPGEVTGEIDVTGLARNPLPGKPSMMVPDNDLTKNIFYWKDRDAMAATAGLPVGAVVLPFFVDAGKAPNPGGLPVGGTTMVDLPNNHLQYALTWYGLAAALVGVVAVWLRKNRKAG
ncbi:MAG TPA: SURF1 family protein [Mesorhizobium sp.]|jgi:surfeit locus 1 family protein|uniref:SURF1 family protein n=1 Tax=Mesorhizobium sp. TaxID=1871066 RepID=UPI002DDD3488|nr:SURF1 family protein [Mesorhizobium sp.]HEV2503094.1 SURF1 family protein [Mesorhizobium sp.]